LRAASEQEKWFGGGVQGAIGAGKLEGWVAGGGGTGIAIGDTGVGIRGRVQEVLLDWVPGLLTRLIGEGRTTGWRRCLRRRPAVLCLAQSAWRAAACGDFSVGASLEYPGDPPGKSSLTMARGW
jgi:hypothetical protein